MPHDDGVGLHGLERADRVHQRLALLEAGRFRLQGHRIGTQARGGRRETDSRAGRRLKERYGDSFPAQRGELFERMSLKLLERFGLVEEKLDLLAAEGFDSEQIWQARRHGFPSITSCLPIGRAPDQ